MPEPVTVKGVHVPGDDYIERAFEPMYYTDVLILYYEGFPISVRCYDGSMTFRAEGRSDWNDFEETIESEPSITKRQVQLRVQKIVKNFKTWVDENLHDDEVASNRGHEIAEMFRAYAHEKPVERKKESDQKEIIPDETETSRKNALVMELLE